MSHRTLQRLVVRMLFDPTLVSRVYRAPDATLASMDLSTQERDWLLAADPRAFVTDAMRPMRLLTALIEEFCVSAALTSEGGAALDRLAAFFSGDLFHAAIAERGVVAFAFADYLTALATRADLADMCALERALAVARRRASGGLLAANVAVVEVSDTTLGSFLRLREVMSSGGQAPAQTLIRDGVVLPEPAVTDARSCLLIQGASVSEISGPLAELLGAAAATSSVEALLAIALRHGASGDEAVELIDELVGDGLLKR